MDYQKMTVSQLDAEIARLDAAIKEAEDQEAQIAQLKQQRDDLRSEGRLQEAVSVHMDVQRLEAAHQEQFTPKRDLLMETIWELCQKAKKRAARIL